MLYEGKLIWVGKPDDVDRTDNAYVEQDTVSISPDVSGRIVDVRVKENQRVKAGDVLFVIDPEPYRIALEQANAAIASAKVDVSTKATDTGSAAADIESANADIALAQATWQRQDALWKKGFTTKAALDAAQHDEQKAFAMITRWSHSGITHLPGTPGPGFSIYNQARRLMERQRPGVLFNDFKACNAYSRGLECAQSITQPTLILSGALDLMTPPKAAKNLAEAITGADMQIIEKAGHQMMAEQSDAVRLAIARFLADAGSRRVLLDTKG